MLHAFMVAALLAPPDSRGSGQRMAAVQALYQYSTQAVEVKAGVPAGTLRGHDSGEA